MGKVVKAVTRIVSDKFVLEPGEILDVKLVTRKDLENLHDVGAIVIEDVADPKIEETASPIEEVQKALQPNTSAAKADVKVIAPKPTLEVKPEVKPKTPETLTKPTTALTKPTVTKTTNPPVGRLTADNIQQSGKSDGQSNAK
jgi:hypothetical protein